MNLLLNAKFDIISVGDCVLDHLYYVSGLDDIDMEQAVLKSSSGSSSKLEVSFGGKGANSIIAASRLGSRCALVSKLGNDESGRSYIEHLNKENIETSHVSISEKAATSTARIFVSPDGSILKQKRVPGATFELVESDIINADSLISQSRILVTSLTLNISTVSTALALGKKNNLLTILNCSPWTMIKSYSASERINTDLLVVNQLEAECLVGFKVNGVSDAQKACETLLSSDSSSSSSSSYSVGVIITLGPDGCVYATRSPSLWTTTPVMVKHFKTRQTNCVDSIGAGDAFLGSLAHFMSHNNQKEEIDRSIELALEYASLSVQRKGAQSSYIDLNQFITSSSVSNT